MTSNFSPSVNISINPIDLAGYFLTSNVQGVFDSVINNYKSGVRSINLIGAYGTGKSSFLSAFSQHLAGNKVFFEAGKWSSLKKFEFINVVGEYSSFIQLLGTTLNTDSEKSGHVLKAFQEYIVQRTQQKVSVVLIVDEFGKLLEYAAKNDPERELFFLQQLAEFVNNGGQDVLWLTTLHQDFAGYALDLNKNQRNEWIKVKGRFKEITFNEPVEQLIYLASEQLNSNVPVVLEKQFAQLWDSISNAKVYPLRDFFDIDVARKLYPLDILSAAILALSLQQYGQNERSLFSFLKGESAYDLREFSQNKKAFYKVSQVYDFLNYNLNSFLLSKANPHYSKWAEIRNALERVEGEFGYQLQNLYQGVIKTIGLFQIFLPGSARISRQFLIEYLGVDKEKDVVDKAISDLEQKFIIRYYNRRGRYSLHEVSDVDIDLALHEAASEVSLANDVVKYLNAYFAFPTITAKRAYFHYGTPRVFQFKITDNPYVSSVPEGEIDGYINLIFNPYLESDDIAAVASRNEEAILYGLFRNANDIKNSIEEIEKAEIAKDKYKDDRIARRELDSIIDAQKNLLSHYVLHSLYDDNIVQWFYRDREIDFVQNNRDFNGLLSDICEEVYVNQPIFRSEIVNKSKLSPAASTARKDLFKGIIEHSADDFLGITGFPPQKSIYFSLLRETGIHHLAASGWVIDQPEVDNCNFLPLFQACDEFVQTTIGAKRSLSELYDKLSKRPFKLKRGFLDFWIPIYLLIKRDDFAMYGEKGFITDLDGEVLELLIKRPKEYAIKAFDTEGIRIDLFNQYRIMLSLDPASQTSTDSFIQTVVPYIKFYKGLHPYVKHTKRISRQAQKVRQALTNATDPEILFFEDFPRALGFDIVQLHKSPELLKDFSEKLMAVMRELRSAYDDLLNRFERVINTLWNQDLEFSQYKDRLRARYQLTLKHYLLLPYQRTFYDRICSPLEQRNAWLSSVAQAVIGKTLENITDEDELKLFDKFIQIIHEMDNLNDFDKHNVDLETEKALRLEITIPGQKGSHRLIRMPKEKVMSQDALEEKMNALIQQEDQFTRIAILAEMLRKELEKNGE
ncbi:hypothetical protein ACFQZX_00505 [Mucilaginibacter litoreus]|uniref:AAA+ ATPase domain-containing protein n=1 Tax=Mucilaginibacter litoreus TaxID=1048221 RepID=A0ABW3AMI6_9SPHI